VRDMRVLVACEESQRVCIAFRELGHEAYSCDLLPCSGGHPEWHIQGDALEVIKIKWDLVIAHPPCTYLSCAGAERTFRKNGVIMDQDRYERGLQAAAFLRRFLDADVPRLCVENPVIMRDKFDIPKYDQIIQPWQFGHPWHKRTCLWLRGLPPLTPTEIVTPTGYWAQRSGKRARGFTGGHRDPKERAKTFPGIARAMAEQWGGDIRGT